MQHDNNISGQVIIIVFIWVLENVLNITYLKVFEYILDSELLHHTLLVFPTWSWFTRCWSYILRNVNDTEDRRPFENMSLETIIYTGTKYSVLSLCWKLKKLFFSVFNLTWKFPGLQRKDSGEGRIKLSALQLS